MLDSRISLMFEELFIPILELEECFIDLKYQNNNYRFKYPLEEGYIFPISEPYTKENNRIHLTILIKTGNKLKKIARGTINLYKRYFLAERKGIDKWIFLRLFETRLEEMGHSSNIIKTVMNTGKIFCRAVLLDPLFEEFNKDKTKMRNSVLSRTSKATAITHILKNALKNLPNIKENIKHNKTEKFRSVIENNNEFLRNIKNMKNITEDLYEDIEVDEPVVEQQKEEFDDGLSDVSISMIDENEIAPHNLDFEALNQEMDILIDQLRDIFENDYDKLLPSNPDELKQYIIAISGHISDVSINYKNHLNNLDELNQRLKFQAQDYYERYKLLKQDFTKERKELRNKKKLLELETKSNQEGTDKILKNYDVVKNEFECFKSKLGIKDEEIEDDDITIMKEILMNVKNVGDITQDLSPEEKQLINGLLDIDDEEYMSDNEDEIRKEQLDYSLEEDVIYDESKVLIEKIEDIVNNLLIDNKIPKIDIVQVDLNIFEFDGVEVKLFLSNDELKAFDKNEKLISFEDWILGNFGLKPKQLNGKANFLHPEPKNSGKKTNYKTPLKK